MIATSKRWRWGASVRLLAAALLAACAPAALAACPGCCSGHGGIANACFTNGRVFCADGTVSPSCLCSSCGVSANPAAPTCSLTASPSIIARGATSSLTASCAPAPTSYTWINAGFAANLFTGLVAPAFTTIYTVRATNAGGTGNPVSTTVTVLAPPICSGGAIWNGTLCACPAGQVAAEGQCYTPAPANACGITRWSIKTGTDTTAVTVDTKVSVPSSVSLMGAIAAPASLPASTRVSPVEKSVYVVDATLTQYRMSDDSDYHLVLVDSAGKTMIAELPHPDCVGESSPFKAAIASARTAFNSQLRATSSFKTISVPVRVVGIGFLDDIHGQSGVAPNGIELHPVLKIEFRPTTQQGSDPQYPLATVSDRLFNWAEAVYANLFAVPGTPGTYQQYTYRYYAKTGNYLATTPEGRVVVHNGRDWNLLDVGAIGDYFPLAVSAGY